MKPHLTPAQQDFIRENYLEINDAQLAAGLGVKAYHILQFRNEQGLTKKAPNDTRKYEGKGKYFKVESLENWLA